MVTAPAAGSRDATDTSHACKEPPPRWPGWAPATTRTSPPHRETGSPDWYPQFLFTQAFDTEELHRVLVDRGPHWLPALADPVPGQLLLGPGPRADHGRRAVPAHRPGLSAGAGALCRPPPAPDLAAIVDEDPGVLADDLPALLDLPNGLSLIVRNRWRRNHWPAVLAAQPGRARAARPHPRRGARPARHRPASR